MINELNEAGVPDGDIKIFFACGTHRLHTAEEHKKIVGDIIASRIKLVDHDCNERDNFVELDSTTRGTPVKLNKAVMDSDRVITDRRDHLPLFRGLWRRKKVSSSRHFGI